MESIPFGIFILYFEFVDAQLVKRPDGTLSISWYILSMILKLGIITYHWSPLLFFLSFSSASS
jgi:hypothetical protein